MSVIGHLSMTAPVLCAVVVGVVTQPVVVRAMTAGGVIDVPSQRSSHTTAVPRGGGVAVVLAAAAGLALDAESRVVVVPLLAYAAIGLAEDVRGLSVPTRLALQAVAGLAAGAVVISYPASALTTALTVVAVALWLASYANAFNFMDGINGISAVHAMLGGLVYAVLGGVYDLPMLTVGGSVVCAAALTFLPWNAGRARIFLGDVGSYGLGAVLATLAVCGLLKGIAVEAVLGPLALYIADTGWTLARRIAGGECWYRPHRCHAYQRLTDAGWPHQRVTAFTAAVSAVVSVLLATAAGSEVPTRISLDAGCLVILAAYLSWPSRLTAVAAGREAVPDPLGGHRP